MEVDVLEDDFDMNENTQRTKIGPLKNQVRFKKKNY